MKNFVVISNVIINADKVLYVMQDPDGERKVSVVFEVGQPGVDFRGHEAAEAWKAFDPEGSWRSEDESNKS